MAQEVGDQVEDDEDGVDQADGRAEEVVIVFGQEFAEFVNEDAEADAAQEGRQALYAGAQEGDVDRDSNEHQQTAVQHVGDMQAAAADLGVAGFVQQEA